MFPRQPNRRPLGPSGLCPVKPLSLAGTCRQRPKGNGFPQAPAFGPLQHRSNTMTNATADIEHAARIIGNDRKALRKRLQKARACLTAEVSRLFGKGKFDFANRRLIGDNGLTLQWRMRRYPNLPESYHNQQTNCGIVVCLGPYSTPEQPCVS